MQRRVDQPGMYWISYKIDSLCEDYMDSFKVTYPAKNYEVSFTTDTIVCMDAPLQFNNTSDTHFKQFGWEFGDQNSSSAENPIHVYTRPGTYTVMLTGQINDRCHDTAYHEVIVDSLIHACFSKDKDSICVGERVTYMQEIDPGTIRELHWQMGDDYALEMFDNRLQHAYDRPGMMEVILNARFRVCPESSFVDTVMVFDLPPIDLGSNTGLCLNGTPVVLKNRHPLQDTGLEYVWNTGAVSKSITVTHPGTYTLRISQQPLGCSSMESVEVGKDCYVDIPNAFTPDGDGINDYFFPRQFLSENVIRFNIQVFNRWGQVVFETTNLNGQGWDGKFNGKNQSGGVYIYRIEAEFGNGKVERYDGNVTLLR